MEFTYHAQQAPLPSQPQLQYKNIPILEEINTLLALQSRALGLVQEINIQVAQSKLDVQQGQILVNKIAKELHEVRELYRTAAELNLFSMTENMAENRMPRDGSPSATLSSATPNNRSNSANGQQNFSNRAPQTRNRYPSGRGGNSGMASARRGGPVVLGRPPPPPNPSSSYNYVSYQRYPRNGPNTRYRGGRSSFNNSGTPYVASTANERAPGFRVRPRIVPRGSDLSPSSNAGDQISANHDTISASSTPKAAENQRLPDGDVVLPLASPAADNKSDTASSTIAEGLDKQVDTAQPTFADAENRPLTADNEDAANPSSSSSEDLSTLANSPATSPGSNEAGINQTVANNNADPSTPSAVTAIDTPGLQNGNATLSPTVDSRPAFEEFDCNKEWDEITRDLAVSMGYLMLSRYGNDVIEV